MSVETSASNKEDIRTAVRERYGSIAREQADNAGGAEQETAACCGGSGSSCCGSPASQTVDIASLKLGYSKEEIDGLPLGANLGLGCGNPQAIANLKPGETVLDLGSGGGIDCFLAAQAVGSDGKVIGVDMTHDMISLARKNAVKNGFANVEFRLGEIEHLPLADSSIDVIISNCVINLSPEKDKVFSEAFRVLKSGGRVAVSDMVASGPVPEAIKSDLSLYSGCVAGASTVEEISEMMKRAGFTRIRIDPKQESREFVKEWAPEQRIEDYVLSASIEAVKP